MLIPHYSLVLRRCKPPNQANHPTKQPTKQSLGEGVRVCLCFAESFRPVRKRNLSRHQVDNCWSYELACANQSALTHRSKNNYPSTPNERVLRQKDQTPIGTSAFLSTSGLRFPVGLLSIWAGCLENGSLRGRKRNAAALGLSQNKRACVCQEHACVYVCLCVRVPFGGLSYMTKEGNAYLEVCQQSM